MCMYIYIYIYIYIYVCVYIYIYIYIYTSGAEACYSHLPCSQDLSQGCGFGRHRKLMFFLCAHCFLMKELC